MDNSRLPAAEDVQAACEAAAKAQSAWSTAPAPRRGEYLFKAAELLESRLAKISEEMTREEGKTLPEAKGEVKRAINILRYFGGEGARAVQLPDSFRARQRVLLHAAQALRGGGAHHSLELSQRHSRLENGAGAGGGEHGGHQAGVAGAAQRLSDCGGAARSRNPPRRGELRDGCRRARSATPWSNTPPFAPSPSPVRAMSAMRFTKKCTRRKLRVQLEMGGKNPTVVLKDADLDYAADVLVNGAFFSTGQKCTACSRAIIEKSIYEPLLEKLVAKTRKLKVGNGLEPGIEIGPAVDAAQLETDLKYIEIAKKEGAKLVCGGKRLTGGIYDLGYFVEPTLFTGVTPEMRIAQEEVFGPVLGLMVADDFEDAMRLANGVKFGLSASIVSRDLTRVHQFINRIEAGLITVNLPTAGVEYQLPFGGTKESSFGMREQGPAALDFYTETRTVYMKYA